jgi:GTPase-associated system helical domain
MTLTDERFPAWFENVELEPASFRLSALREASETLAERLPARHAIDLVTYAMGRRSVQAFQVVVTAVSAHDRSFAPAADDLEPRLVAAAAVARVLERAGEDAAAAAGAVLSGEFAGLSSPLAELPALARAAIAERFRRARTRIPAPSLDVLGRIEGETAVGTEYMPPEAAIRRLREESVALARELQSAITTLGQRFDARLDAADEELDILWWAFSAPPAMVERGRWDEPSESAAASLLRAGLELAARHRRGGEVPSAREILRRVLGPLANDEFAISDVVEGTAAVSLDPVEPNALLPILTSAGEYLAFREAELISFGGERSWIDSCLRYGVDPSLRHQGEEIAAQTLRELLLARAMR